MIPEIPIILSIVGFAISSSVGALKLYKIVFNKSIVKTIVDKINHSRQKRGKPILSIDDEDLDDLEDEVIDITEKVVNLVSVK